MTKLNIQQLPDIFKDVVTAEYANDKLTLTSVKGDKIEIELSPKDNYVKEVEYNSTTHKLTITKLDDTTTDLSLEELYNIYTGVDGTQVKVEVDSDNKITATIKENAITRKELAKVLTDELDKIVDEGTIDGKIAKAVSVAAAASTAPSSELGDVGIMELNRTAESIYVLRGQMHNTKEGYDEDFTDGYVFSGQAESYRGKSFNRIKVEVAIPGLVRIGIVNNHVFDAKPRYSKCLVKWLVVRFAAYTGLKEYDIEDTVLGEDEWLFVECRVGHSGCYQNTTNAAITDGVFTMPANSCSNGRTNAITYDANTNGALFKSNSLTTASARFTYSSVIKSSKRAMLRAAWTSVDDYRETPFESPALGDSFGDLNLGIYEKGSGSDSHPFEIMETSINGSTISGNNWYAYRDYSDLIGKTVYALKLEVYEPGTMSICKMTWDPKKPEDSKILEIYTHYFRSRGLNQWVLPKEMVLKEGEILAVQGYCRDIVPANYLDEGNEDPYYKATSCKFYYNCAKYELEQIPNNKLGWYDIKWDSKTGDFTGVYHTSGVNEEGKGTAYLNIDFVVKGDRLSKLEGLLFSVQGDSISTYDGEITKQSDYPAGNSAGNNAVYFPAAGQVNNVGATWWGILVRDKRMRLLRNDAWSGSRVSGTGTTAASSDERCSFLQNTAGNMSYRTTFDYGAPHLILSNIGTNDLSGNIALGSLNRTNTHDYNTILGAFSAMCCKMRQRYPQTKIVHFILPRGNVWTYKNGNNVYMSQLAEGLEQTAKAWGQYFIPLSYFGKLYPTYATMWRSNATYGPEQHYSNAFASASNVDYLHPSVPGMEVVAEGISSFLETIF